MWWSVTCPLTQVKPSSPDFFEVDQGLYASKISSLPIRKDIVFLGRYDASAVQFDRETERVLYDHGSWYASKTFFDPVKSRRILWGWIPEDDSYGPERGWQGMQSLPREMSYDHELNMYEAQKCGFAHSNCLVL